MFIPGVGNLQKHENEMYEAIIYYPEAKTDLRKEHMVGKNKSPLP